MQKSGLEHKGLWGGGAKPTVKWVFFIYINLKTDFAISDYDHKKM